MEAVTVRKPGFEVAYIRVHLLYQLESGRREGGPEQAEGQGSQEDQSVVRHEEVEVDTGDESEQEDIHKLELENYHYMPGAEEEEHKSDK